MGLKEYFSTTKGLGVFSSANTTGEVNSAVYSRPYVIDDQTVAFLMTPKLSYENIKSNGHASYLFKEDNPGYRGKRLTLTYKEEEKDPAKVDAFRKANSGDDLYERYRDTEAALVTFTVTSTRPLVGSAEK